MARRNNRNRERNVVPFSGEIHLNIGVVIFAFIAIYIAFNIYSFFTAQHIVSYEVEKGTIEVNTSYTGLILRSETVVNAEQTGKLDYYLKDNTKAGANTLICSIDENGNVSEKLNEPMDASAVLESDNLEDLQDSIRNFAYTYTDNGFFSTYNFKADISGKLMEAMNLSTLEEISEYSSFARENQTFHLYRTQTHGVVAYYTDGYESLTVDRLTPGVFDKTTYQKVSRHTNGEIESGEAIYKIITDENWKIVAKIDQAMIDMLGDVTSVEIRFKEDGTTAWTNCEVQEIGGESYLVLSLWNSMIRYADERFVDINILLDQQSGLKIPNSAITDKSFLLVPQDYLTYGNAEDSEKGLLVEHLKDNGDYSEAEFVPVTIYYQTEDYIYLSQDDINIGDLIVMTGSTQRYEVAETDKLQGVYNINKGYAVFKQIEIMYQNDDYTIIKSGTEYGITMYDHIALISKNVSENQML